ncbi:MAG: hypothetical protein AAF733_09415 [Verrucomicrobiota bacterium]
MKRGRQALGIIGLLLCFVLPATASDPRVALQSITLPSIELQDVALEEALEFLQMRSRELSGSPSSAVNFILQGDAELRRLPISLNLENVTLGQTLWFVSEIGQLKFEVDRHAIVVSKPEEWKSVSAPPIAADQVIARKVKEIHVPGIEWDQVPLRDAVDLLRTQARELDPEKVGVNFVLLPDPDKATEKEITLRLQGIPLAEAIRYTAQLANHTVRIEGGAILLAPIATEE